MNNPLKTINTTFENIFGYVGIAMILIASWSVFARTIIGVSATWTDEVLKMLFVWSIFTCSGLAFYKGELIGLDLLAEKIQKDPIKSSVLKILQNFIAIVFAVLTVWFAINIISVQLMTGESTTVVQIPLWFINLGFLLGNILIAIFATIKAYIEILKIRHLKK